MLEDLKIKMTNPKYNKEVIKAERDECNANVINLKGIVIR